MIDTREDIVDEYIRAKKALEKMKNYEAKTKMFTARINDKTIVCCKNEDRIEQYKKLR